MISALDSEIADCHQAGSEAITSPIGVVSWSTASTTASPFGLIQWPSKRATLPATAF